VVRRLLLPTLFLPALAACQTDNERHRNMGVSVGSKELAVYIAEEDHSGELHCLPWWDGSAFVNGIEMTVEEKSDGNRYPCRVSHYFTLDLALLPEDTQTLDVTFDLTLASGEAYAAARTLRTTVQWRPERVWSVDDLAARMHTGEAFEVHWTPADTLVPELGLRAYQGGYWSHLLGTRATLIDAAPGVAHYRFDGPEPSDMWEVGSYRARELKVTRCSGFQFCGAHSVHGASLTPGGVPPPTPEGVAPPRQCIMAPGKKEADYSSPTPASVTFPDLSQHRLERRESCHSADLYFVVLGVCGVCGGGKSSYAIGNRGTQPASFRVRSNKETIEGGLLEPQQLSQPFEISFAGALSELEIITDDDCDPGSNKTWVESSVCEDDPSCRLVARHACEGRDRSCNNLCGL
jgi:hypothetical protein